MDQTDLGFGNTVLDHALKKGTQCFHLRGRDCETIAFLELPISPTPGFYRLRLSRSAREIETPSPTFVASRQMGEPTEDEIERFRSEEHTSELQSLMRISY